MHPKIKRRTAGAKTATGPLKPLLLHEVANTTAAALVASRRPTTTPSASGPANHSRHHVSRLEQS